MSDAGDSRTPRLARGCRLGQDGVLLMPEGILKLSETGLKIVQLCDGQRPLSRVIREIQADYPPEQHERIEADVRAYIDALAGKKALELVG